MTTDAEKSFHDIRLNKEEDIFVQLNFRSSHSCHQYVAVLEDNPFMPKNLQFNEKDRAVAEEIIRQSLRTFREEKLMQEIDLALDRHDRETFEELSNQLKVLHESQ